MTIAVAGNHNYTSEQVLQIAQLRVGEIAGKKALDAAHERLMSSGIFNSVAYKYVPAGKGIAVSIDVVEVNAFYPILFEDLPVDEAQLRTWLKQQDPLFGPKISATKESLAHYVDLVSQYLAAHDHAQPVTAKLSSENPPDLIILIRPATARPSVAQVTAKNTGEIPAGVVQSTLYGVAVGSIYSEPRMRQLLDSSVRPLYEAVGRVRVAFPKIEGEPAKDVKGIAVTVQVEQGPVFNFGKVKFAGVANEVDELQNLVKIKSGVLANFDDVRKAQGRLEDHFKHIGYLQVKTEVGRDVHDAEKTVDLTFRIETGPQFTFHELTIAGLDITSEPTIRKLWGLYPGKPYNPDYPEHFLERVKEMGLFDNLKNTAFERKINADEHTVDVTLTFK